MAELADVLRPEVSVEQVDRRWQEQRDGHRAMLIAEVDGRIAGTVSIGGHSHRLPNSLRLFALDVGPAFRRKGVGAALIDAVEKMARRRGIQSVNLEVAVEKGDALRLYERRGYQRLGSPVPTRWTRLADDGSCEQVEDLSWTMTKRV